MCYERWKQNSGSGIRSSADPKFCYISSMHKMRICVNSQEAKMGVRSKFSHRRGSEDILDFATPKSVTSSEVPTQFHISKDALPVPKSSLPLKKTQRPGQQSSNSQKTHSALLLSWNSFQHTRLPAPPPPYSVVGCDCDGMKPPPANIDASPPPPSEYIASFVC